MTCSEKVRFKTRAEARRVLRRWQSTPRAVRRLRQLKPGYQPDSLPHSIYRCRDCGGYHLTSQTK